MYKTHANKYTELSPYIYLHILAYIYAHLEIYTHTLFTIFKLHKTKFSITDFLMSVVFFGLFPFTKEIIPDAIATSSFVYSLQFLIR